MLSNADNRNLFLMRGASVLLLVYVVVGFAAFGESDGFKDWSGSVRWTLPLMLLFVAGYTWMQVTILRGLDALTLRLLWFEALLLVPLHFGMEEPSMMLSFVAFWIARTPQSYDLRTCIRLTAGALAFFFVVLFLRSMELDEFLVLLTLSPAIAFFVLSISYTSISLQRQRLELLALNRELQTAQLQLAQSSRTSERLRIAREIHDLLGHQMTALILNLEVATHKTSGAGLIHVERAHALARMLLSDLRNAVSDMRENPALDFDSALNELLANVPELNVTLERDENVAVHDQGTAEALLRCTQEALTNTLRHARATSCHIHLYQQDGELVLDIRDDGVSPARVTPGNGLKGMQERLATVAGTLHWHNDNGSFRLRARVPLGEVA
jgi:two-component system, NarL family, sensor histidine kinase DesK